MKTVVIEGEPDFVVSLQRGLGGAIVARPTPKIPVYLRVAAARSFACLFPEVAWISEEGVPPGCDAAFMLTPHDASSLVPSDHGED